MTSKDFEKYVNQLLNIYGYTSINPTNKVKGRGTTHQIDAIGVSKFTQVFSYPITLVTEAKFYSSKRPIGIEIIRNFYGVLNDIKQNLPNKFTIPEISKNTYINGTSNVIGVIISTTSFSSFARAFAYSHGIFMVSMGYIKKDSNLYFGNIGGELVLIQIPKKLIFESLIEKNRRIKLTYLTQNKSLILFEREKLSAILILKKVLVFNNEDSTFIENTEEFPQDVKTYLYDINVLEWNMTFRTITQNKIDNNNGLKIEIPEINDYLNIDILEIQNRI
ncbi:restriction endonuclease [Fontibacter flavus]|uniref:Restriction endonuclease n=1 Tax=Fontibacter flavus TaxID=654838 RepID=A0ABV6FVA7_9BACT